MSENSYVPESNMEDISSTSAEYRAKKDPIDAYGKSMFKNLGNIIKAIAFIL